MNDVTYPCPRDIRRSIKVLPCKRNVTMSERNGSSMAYSFTSAIAQVYLRKARSKNQASRRRSQAPYLFKLYYVGPFGGRGIMDYGCREHGTVISVHVWVANRSLFSPAFGPVDDIVSNESPLNKASCLQGNRIKTHQ